MNADFRPWLGGASFRWNRPPRGEGRRPCGGRRSSPAWFVAFCAGIVLFAGVCQAADRPPIPDKVVVLTFDDSVKSHFTVVRPILKKYGFGATFFITEGFEFASDKENYMTWEEIAELSRDGFEIGNHTRDHVVLDARRPERLRQKLPAWRDQLEAINDRCREHGIPRTISFAYPGNGISADVFPILDELGIVFARRGGAPEYAYDGGRGFAYEPGLDHPLLIPSAGDARPDWGLDDFRRAVDQARQGRIAVLQFHGVPDVAHPWVNSPVEKFEGYMRYLAHEGFEVIAVRDLVRYVDPDVRPHDPDFVIKDRQRALAEGAPRDNFRRPADRDDLRRWLENMVWYHRFSLAEIGAATGMTADEITSALDEFDIRPENRPVDDSLGGAVRLLPYPGGRHPRIGFLDGAIRPQRETKASVFLPWDPASYVVIDVPEAIRRDHEAEHGLLYLAHTHVDTMWTRRGLDLEPLEWKRTDEGTLEIERTLPNGVRFGARLRPRPSAVEMELWLANGSDEPLRDLRVQNCVMLKAASEFISDDPARTVEADPFIARSSTDRRRWLITGWQRCARTWANRSCPCLHSDPEFPRCAPGQTHHLRGWLSFYEGEDLPAELRRLGAEGWLASADSATE